MVVTGGDAPRDPRRAGTIPAVDLHPEPLTDETLDEAVAFFGAANPFSQKTWGWDTGRFVDWRWGRNAVVFSDDPGWFGRNCRLFREDGRLRLVAVAEYGEDDVCLVTGAEDPAAVAAALASVRADHERRGLGLALEFSDRAAWLREVCREAGLVEEPATGHEWEYDLAGLPEVPPVPDGFEVLTLADTGDAVYRGVSDCLRAAFGVERDLVPQLRHLEANPMFRPELSVVAVAPGGRVAGYCRGTADAGNGVCGIDPVATHPDFQGRGLAKAVVLRCLHNQRALGGRFAYIGSAPEPAPGTFLYRSLGPAGRTTACTWRIPAEGSSA